MKIKNILKFIRSNYLLSFFLALVFFTLFTGFIKITASKPTYIYVKVKMGQGLWWASTAKPALWFVQALKKGETEKSLLGRPIAEILGVRYYPYPGRTDSQTDNQYDVYVTLKLSAEINKKNNTYSFKRSSLVVGSPIEFEFPSVQVSGTVIELSKTPFRDEYIEKTVYLVHKDGYRKESPYAFESLQVGDKYFDGESYVFEVLEKKLQNRIESVHNILTGRVYEQPIATGQDFVAKVKIMVEKKNDSFMYAKEYKLAVNAKIPFMTNTFVFADFFIGKIE